MSTSGTTSIEVRRHHGIGHWDVEIKVEMSPDRPTEADEVAAAIQSAADEAIRRVRA